MAVTAGAYLAWSSITLGYSADKTLVMAMMVLFKLVDAVEDVYTGAYQVRDRLDVGAELYFAGVAPKVLVSGDNGDISYNEVAAMKEYLIELGIPSEDVFCDHSGFNTYDSMWRARNVFGAERIVVVTQTYHEYRALYNAHGVGMQARGVSSDLHTYTNQDYYDFREVFARLKDFGQVLIGAKATSVGEPVSLDQSGDVTG
jgi:vancomycin permeability regulator SanA